MDTDLPAGAESVVICAPDNAGRLIGKSIPAGRWKSVLAEGLPMPNFHLITGIENVPLDGLSLTGPLPHSDGPPVRPQARRTAGTWSRPQRPP